MRNKHLLSNNKQQGDSDRKRFIKLRGYMMNHDAQQENETKRGGGEA